MHIKDDDDDCQRLFDLAVLLYSLLFCWFLRSVSSLYVLLSFAVRPDGMTKQMNSRDRDMTKPFKRNNFVKQTK